VQRSCAGGHKTRKVTCQTLKLECQEKCGNLLACGNHTCSFSCHNVNLPRKIVSEETIIDIQHPLYHFLIASMANKDQSTNITIIVSKVVPRNDSYQELTKLDQQNSRDLQITNSVNVEQEHNDPEDTCEQCALPCNKPSKCKHGCSIGHCHLKECPPCGVPIVFECFCGIRRVNFECWKTFHEHIVEKARCCGTKCGRKLPNCNHLCESSCHPGACSSNCKKKVTVRCQCNQIKKSMTCSEARQKVEESKQNLSGSDKSRTAKYSLDSYNILPCGEQCSGGSSKVAQQQVDQNQDQKQVESPASASPLQLKQQVSDKISFKSYVAILVLVVGTVLALLFLRS